MIFISYASKDLTQATQFRQDLERRGVACWIAARDIGPGENYQESIDASIQRARALVVFLTAHAIASAEIKKEMSLASAYGVPVIPARAEPVTPTGAFKYELATVQWIDLFANREHALDRLAERISQLGQDRGPPDPAEARPGPIRRRTSRLVLRLCAAIAVLAGVSAGVVALRHQTTLSLRSTPATLRGSQIDAMLTRLDLYDERRNPAGHGISHRLTPQVIGEAVVVTDEATGLMWQRRGSEEGMPLSAAASYIDRLNTGKYAGFTDWRLPTLEEALSLNDQRPNGEWHIAAEFLPGSSANFVWTADRSVTSGRGFVVYYYNGFLSTESADYNAYVRAVRRLAR